MGVEEGMGVEKGGWGTHRMYTFFSSEESLSMCSSITWPGGLGRVTTPPSCSWYCWGAKSSGVKT